MFFLNQLHTMSDGALLDYNSFESVDVVATDSHEKRVFVSALV